MNCSAQYVGVNDVYITYFQIESWWKFLKILNNLSTYDDKKHLFLCAKKYTKKPIDIMRNLLDNIVNI